MSKNQNPLMFSVSSVANSPVANSLLGQSRRGFILIMVVGALAVLVILGLQFADQSRIDLLGAANTRDLAATEELSESGFQIALRILADDRNVDSASNSMDTPGWTSRWGYNSGAVIPASGAAPNRDTNNNFLDSWQCLIWSNQRLNLNALQYLFAFDENNLVRDRFSQRYPVPSQLMQDVWQLQPFACVRKYRLSAGASFGLVQIGITSLDGGFNLNDVFDPGTVTERPGVHDENLYGGTQTANPLASPDRRTLEYMLGRRPEYAYQHAEYSDGPRPSDVSMSDDKRQFIANQPAGSVYNDNGVYNFRAYYEPSGRSCSDQVPDYRPAWQGFGRVNYLNHAEPTLFYNAGCTQPNRYNFEAPRYVMWASNTGMSRREWNKDTNNTRELLTGKYDRGDDSANRMWYPAGRYKDDVVIPRIAKARLGERDILFHGFGFDLQNPQRAGVGVTTGSGDPALYYKDPNDFYYNRARYNYKGAGVYGHPQPRSFQNHFLPAVAKGRFWTDLEAAWYFGGAPGYTTQLGISVYYATSNNWTHLGSSYDSLGMGSHWMPPTMHVWMPGFWDKGMLGAHEISRGMPCNPGNMLPAKPAATYAYPMRKWGDDMGNDSAHLLFNSVRLSIRANGIQENWGLNGQSNANGRFYDAININVSNFNVIYGLLTPEKIPSMLNRTVVAPHLHWKARMRDDASHRHTGGGRIWGKMDFTNIDTGGVVPVDRGVSNEPADDVFTDARYDLSLSPNSNQKNATLDGSTMMPRPDNPENHADWFMQRNVKILASNVPIDGDTPAQKDAKKKYKPQNNHGTAPLDFPEGRKTIDYVPAVPRADTELIQRTDPQPRPHPIHGLPNPDYLLLYPGTDTSIHWADQYRRYFPVVFRYSGLSPNQNAENNVPGTPENVNKMRTDEANPWLPVKQTTVGDIDHDVNPYNDTPFVPTINKDEAWRITRIGRKYQEIIADEIMDYQINPWWPNPIAIYNDNGALLNQQPLDQQVRINALALPNLAVNWPSFANAPQGVALTRQMPDYYAYYNRFWVRAALRYTRGQSNGEPYRAANVGNTTLMNPVENRGIYPQAYQYFGQTFPSGTLPPLNRPPNIFKDRILDFPFNTLEDQSGAEWRYASGVSYFMNETNMPNAPARNHPFKNWADFVAMLGHLVYRSPIIPPLAPPVLAAAMRDPVRGVDATKVSGVPGTFFDGSKIFDADSLQQKVVARAGFWPISANYGEYHDPLANPVGPALYPTPPPSWLAISTPAEWNRRLDEWRGRDAAGLRVEHNYISERAANDVLVSLSNGKIAPIDFDGDGHITMTRKEEVLGYGITLTNGVPVYNPSTLTNPYWPGYPWHSTSGATTGNKVERRLPPSSNGTDLDYGVIKGAWDTNPVDKSEIIQGCVTLPIKFRSNTFRITVIAELTNSSYTNSYGSVRYSRVYSRVPGPGGDRVHGQYTGQFMLHEKRVMRGGVDPVMSWLGCDY
ncbi:MAG: hypothetical protein V1899_08415 [Planctomycetota bacterium]